MPFLGNGYTAINLVILTSQNNMDILLTGSDGFIAKNIVHIFEKHNIILLNRKRVDLTCSVQVNNFLHNKKFDAVIHTASAGVTTPQSFDVDILDQNLIMYYNILQHRDKFFKFINIGSGAEKTLNNYPYGMSKTIINSSILHKENFYNLRVYGVFGYNELVTRFIKANILNYINRKPLIVNQNKRMDFIYINDLANIINHYVTSSDRLPTEYDCVYDTKYSLLEIANFINSLDSYSVDIVINNSEPCTDYTGEHTHLSKCPSMVGLQRGIEEMYKFLKQ